LGKVRAKAAKSICYNTDVEFGYLPPEAFQALGAFSFYRT